MAINKNNLLLKLLPRNAEFLANKKRYSRKKGYVQSNEYSMSVPRICTE